MLKCSTGYL